MVRVGNYDDDKDKYLLLRYRQKVQKAGTTAPTSRPALLGITNPQNRVRNSAATAANYKVSSNQTTNQTTSTQNLNSLGSNLTQLTSALQSFEVPTKTHIESSSGSTRVSSATLNGTESADELRKIIEADEGKLQSLQGQSTEIDTQEANAKEKLETSDKAVGDAQSNHDKAQQDLNLAKDGEKSANSKKLSAKTALDSAETKLTNATNTYNQRKQQTQAASSAYESAKGNTQTAQKAATAAEKTLQNTPKTLPNGAENPAYATALQAKTQADANLKKAQEAEEKAQNDYSTAKTNEEQALKEKDAAQQDRDTKQTEYKKAETQHQQAQKKLTQATQTEKEASAKLEQAKADKSAAQQELDKATVAKEEHYKNIQNLQSSINENKATLKTLEAAEKSKKSKPNPQSKEEKKDTPDLTDHVSAEKSSEQKEKRLTNVGANNAAQASRVTQEDDYSNPTMLLYLARQNPKIGNDGGQYRMAEFGGKKYYSRNGVLIPQEQYRRATQS